ncbi:MAG TPA: extracellular solute-binding protein [Firmicutes bacterium]|nr:extracellular solute-binding protein [Bacillota bacterium]
MNITQPGARPTRVCTRRTMRRVYTRCTMRRVYTRCIVLILLVCFVSGSMSCGFIVFNDPTTESTTPGTTESTTAESTTVTTTTAPTETTEPVDPREEADKLLDSLADRNLGGAGVIIATTDDETICPLSSDDEVIAARSVATRAVEDKYNALIITDLVDSQSMLDAALEAVAADMYYADLLAVPLSRLGSFMQAGILMNMYSLPYTDYTKSYYYDVTDEAVFGGELMAAYGAANFNPEQLSCVYFNRDLIAEYSLDNPYDLVYSGDWTWEELARLSREVNAAAGVYGHGTDYTTDEYISGAALSMGIDYVTNRANQAPFVSYMAEDKLANDANGIVDILYRMLYNNSALAPEGDSSDLFTSGELLFDFGSLEKMTSLTNRDVNWGILPYPKYDEEQRHYLSPLSSDAPVFCALASTPNYETSGLILEALNASYYGYTNEIYMNERINYCLRDNDSINMLELILDGATSDFAHMFASGFASLANATYSAVINAVTTRSTLTALYQSWHTAADSELAAAATIYE